MKTIIAGSSKGITFEETIKGINECPWEITHVVSGRAPGVDTHGEVYAVGRYLPLSVFPADWERHKYAAGPIRNRQMAENAEALVAIWNGRSPGTRHMIETAKKLNLRVFVYLVGGNALDEFS